MIVAALMPFFASFYFATQPSTAPPLTITRSQSDLQFATYLIHHGEDPVELSAELLSVFPFRNTGTTPITIGEIERSCGCMKPQLSTQTVQPGEEGKLYVPIATANQSPGFHEYMLTVNYTDTEPRQATLSIKATFPKKMVMVKPKALFLSQSSQKPIEYPRGVSISDFRQNPLKVKDVASSSSFLTVELAEETRSAEAGSSTTFDVRVAGSFPAGRHRLLVAATTDDPEFPVLTVPVWIDGPDRPKDQVVQIKPDRVTLRVQPAATASLSNSEDEATGHDQPVADIAEVAIALPPSWKISHVESWPAELQVTYEKSPGASTDRQVIQLTAAMSDVPADGLTEGSISILANDSKDMVTVPVQIVWP
jgi:hypothetical protein